MSDWPTLDEAVEGILGAIGTLLTAAQGEGLPLDGVVQVYRGGMGTPRPPTPVVMYWPDRARAVERTFRIREEWILTVMIGAVVNSDDPTMGPVLATSYAAKARGVLLEHQHLTGLPYVASLNSTQFEPSGPMSKKGTLYGAMATLEARFFARY